MTEIRIEEFDAALCSFEGCTRKSRRWITKCGTRIFNACEEHGPPVQYAIQRHQMTVIYDERITITGGYDDEPKSKLEEMADRIADSGIWPGRATIEEILTYLIKKEKTDG